jgi:hypothetical protein
MSPIPIPETGLMAIVLSTMPMIPAKLQIRCSHIQTDLPHSTDSQQPAVRCNTMFVVSIGPAKPSV